MALGQLSCVTPGLVDDCSTLYCRAFRKLLGPTDHMRIILVNVEKGVRVSVKNLLGKKKHEKMGR